MTKRIKVALDCSGRFSFGGYNTNQVIMNHLSFRENQSIELTVVGSINSQSLNKFPNVKFVDSSIYESNALLLRLWRIIVLPRILKKLKIDLLVNTGSHFIPFPRDIVVAQNELPFCSDQIRRYGLFTGKIRLILLRIKYIMLYRLSKTTIFISYSLKRICQEISAMEMSNSLVVYLTECNTGLLNSNDITDASRKSAIEIVYVASFEPYKNLDSAVKACKGLRALGYDIHLSIVGPVAHIPTYEMVLQLIQVLSIQDNVTMHTDVLPRDVNKYYESADVGLMISSCEAFSYVLREMITSNVKIVSSRLPSVMELGPLKGIQFCDERSWLSVALAIRRALGNKDIIDVKFIDELTAIIKMLASC